MTRPPAKLSQILKNHPQPNAEIATRRTKRLIKMVHFYRERADRSTGSQAYIFGGFAKALNWAVFIVYQYRNLLRELHELEGDDDETRPNSPRR